MKIKLLSIMIALMTVLAMFPISAGAMEENVFISISFDGQYIDGANGDKVAFVKVPVSELEAIDLGEYGLDEYYFDGDGDGVYDITALHLYIYTHETLLGLDWNDVIVSGGPGSIFFEEGLFGFVDCNLNYYYNGTYPEVYEGWGATADNLCLYPGDFYDIAGYTSWAFWGDSATGFHYFADENGEFTHKYTTQAGAETPVKLVLSGGGFGGGLTVSDVAYYDIYYGTSFGDATGTITTDECGEATLPALTEGTWYLWCDGGYGAEYSGSIVSAPSFATVVVEGGEPLPATYTVLGNIESFGDADKSVTVELISDGETVATTLATNTYTFEEVEAGTYTLKVSKSKHATREYEIVVTDDNVSQDVTIWLYGDVTADGIVNNADVLQINRKTSNQASVFSQTTNVEYREKVANVTAITGTDTIINNADVLQINRKTSNQASVFDTLA